MYIGYKFAKQNYLQCRYKRTHFKSLGLTVSKLKTEKEKLCIIVFDEMSISSMLTYNQKQDVIEGLEDYEYTHC